MRGIAPWLLIGALVVPASGSAQVTAPETSAVVAEGSYVRIEYSRYFARRREIVDSAELARATRSRRFDVRGTVEELSATHIAVRAHDRVRTIPRWQVDRAWLYVHTGESDHAGESFAEWGIGGVVAGVLVAGLAIASCDDSDEYCGLGAIILMAGIAGAGVVSAFVAAAEADTDDFVEVGLQSSF